MLFYTFLTDYKAERMHVLCGLCVKFTENNYWLLTKSHSEDERLVSLWSSAKVISYFNTISKYDALKLVLVNGSVKLLSQNKLIIIYQATCSKIYNLIINICDLKEDTYQLTMAANKIKTKRALLSIP